MNKKYTPLAIALASSLASSVTLAGDVEIGRSTQQGMDIAAVYIQPVMMQPMLPGMDQQTDIHLEADISATADNKQGFAEGMWIPYLTITYSITKQGSDWKTIGTFMPMAAADGPHYANNIKLDGAGKYHLSYHIEAPTRAGFYHHTDKETGIAQWWQPIDLAWDFVFAGYGKKGGY